MANRGHNLIYGGSHRGLMGEVAKQLSQENIREITPEIFADSVINLERATITKDFEDRKKLMWGHSDSFIALPGGVGTLDEIFFALLRNVYVNEKNLTIKPLTIINIGGFYYSLKEQFNLMYQKNFIPEDNKQMYSFVENPYQALDFIEHFKQPKLKNRKSHCDK